MRRALALLVALAALVPASASGEERSWRPPTVLTDGLEGTSTYRPHEFEALTVTSDGVAIAAWGNDGGSNQKVWMATASPADGSPAVEELDAQPGSYTTDLAADGLGNAYVAYWREGALKLRVRPPGGGFGPEEPIPGGWPTRLIASPDGDVAAIWVQFSQLFVSIRPKGGSFGPAESLTSAGYWSAAFSAGGDLVAAGISGNAVEVAVRSPSGAVTRQLLEGSLTGVAGTTVGIDDEGRAVVAWAEQRNPAVQGIDRVRMAQRPAGGSFGSPLAMTRAGGIEPLPRVVVARDGLYTLAYSGGEGTRFATGRTGGPPSFLRAYGSPGYDPAWSFVGSPSGNHALMTAYAYQPRTAVRSGDAPFTRTQALRSDCGGADYVRTAIGDGGHAAALVQQGSSLRLVTDASGRQADPCAASDYDPYRGSYSAPSGSGQWVDAPPPSGTAAPPQIPVPDLPLGKPGLARAKPGTLERKARVVVLCGVQCTIKGRARIGFAGEAPLAEGRTRLTSNGRATALAVPLTLAKSEARRVDAALAGTGPGKALVLSFDVATTDAGTRRKRARTAEQALNGSQRR
ncbi:MAG TPA: hypothetical protein VF712_08690 [Thermoleophilaceae bacterium]